MTLSCRFYKHKLPECGEVVMVSVGKVANMGSYVQLLEYNNIEGMILTSELSSCRIRSINKLIRTGRNEIVVVTRVDNENGYVDLSKRRVSEIEKIECRDKFRRGKIVDSILRRTAEMLNFTKNEQLEDLYDRTAWKIDEKMLRIGASFDAFKLAINNSSVLDNCDIPPKWKEVLLSNIKHSLMPQPVKCSALVKISCYSYEGIDAIKEAIREGLKLSTEEMPLSIVLITSPSFVITSTSLNRDKCLKHLDNVIERIKETIVKKNGSCCIQEPPKAISDAYQTELETEFQKLDTIIDAEENETDSWDISFSFEQAPDVSQWA